jgi:hypothetical protein
MVSVIEQESEVIEVGIVGVGPSPVTHRGIKRRRAVIDADVILGKLGFDRLNTSQQHERQGAN